MKLKSPLQLDNRQTPREHHAEIIQNMEIAREHAQQNLENSRSKMKSCYDKHAFNPQFTIGDTVYIYFPSLSTPLASRKLISFWSGPYIIIEQCSHVGFKVCQCADNKLIKQKFHINRFKRCYEHDRRPDWHCTPLTLEADDVTDDLQNDDLPPNEQELCKNMHGHA